MDDFTPRDTKFNNKLERELQRKGLSATYEIPMEFHLNFFRVVRDREMKKDDPLRTSTADLHELQIKRMVSPSVTRNQQVAGEMDAEAEEISPVFCQTEATTKKQLQESFLQFYRYLKFR